jgi:hypothetical protein
MCDIKFANLTIILSLTFYSCEKNDVSIQAFSEARYSLTVTGKWISPGFSVPAGVHFTTFLGMVHNNETYLWKDNTKASLGVENVAESGNTTQLRLDVDSIIAVGKAISLIAISAPLSTGSSKMNIYCNSNYSYISFESMLAPTPDWFTGLSGFNLFQNNKWISDTTINLYAWDAGTEDGDVFGYNNPATAPQQNIHLLLAPQATVLANGNSLLAPIATARFTRQ